ncbi:MAG: M20/M25/M40 family metallo-hydrolase, partial [Phycisphaerae bacterium]
ADQQKANLLIRCGPARDDREGLILSGHMDVVPPGESGWSSDPFSLRDDGERLFGRGACDMKGFLALAMNELLRHADGTLDAPLCLLFTFDEEVGTLGAQHFRETWHGTEPLPSHAVIGEPTKLQPVRMHKGHLKLRIVARGKSAHSGYPSLGVNSIEMMGGVIQALASLDQRLRNTPYPTAAFYPEAPYCSLNQAVIDGGSAVNVVPEKCTLDLGVRLLPGVEADEILVQIDQALSSLPQRELLDIETGGISPALETPATCRHHAFLTSQQAAVTPEKNADHAGTGAVAFASDAGVFAKMDMTCILYGPGDIGVAHRPDEFIPRGEMVTAASVVGKLVSEFCSHDPR